MNCSYPLKLIVRLLTFRFGTGLSLYYGENLQTQEVYNTYKTKAKASYVTEGPTRLTRRAADHRVGGSGGFLFEQSFPELPFSLLRRRGGNLGLLLVDHDVELPLQESHLSLLQLGLPLLQQLLLHLLLPLGLHQVDLEAVQLLLLHPDLLQPVADLLSPVLLHQVEALVGNVGQVGLGHHIQSVDDGLEGWPMVAIKLPTVFHQAPPVFGAGAGYVQVQLVHGDSVGNCHVVDPLVGGLPSQQLPQHNAITENVQG